MKNKIMPIFILIMFVSGLSLNEIPVKEPQMYIQDVEKRESIKYATKIVKPRVVRYKYIGTYTVTHYCTCKICCGKHANGITASGKKAKPGMIAASRGMKFGTRLKIEGKVYSVQDRLAVRYDNRIDILVKDHKTAIRMGIKRVKIYMEVAK